MITQKEMNMAIQKLKRNKSEGPDGIPNKVLIEADLKTRDIYRCYFNQILLDQLTPDQ